VIVLDASLMSKSTGTWGMMKILEKEMKPYLLVLFKKEENEMAISKKMIHHPGNEKPLTKRLGEI
jgi:hypothetical protein